MERRTERVKTSEERGATIIQFVLIFPLLILIFAAIIDISLMFSVESLLDEAAHRAVQRAAVISNLDVNPNGARTSQYEYQRILLARTKSNASGIEFLQETKSVDVNFVSPNPQSQAKLLPLSYTQTGTAGPDTTITDGIMVLVPGDCLTVVSSGEIICNRETLGTNETYPPPAQQPAFLMRRHPIMAVAVGQYDGYLPFFRNKTLMARSYAYRQAVPPGPFAAWEDPELLAEGPPLPFKKKEVKTLPAPEMPEPEEFTVCTPNWTRCMMETEEARQSGENLPKRPVNIDYGDGTCRCDEY